MRILQGYSSRQIIEVMRDIRVDPSGIEIMAPKAMHYLIKIDAVSNIAANILKQEILSLGGDAAIARGALTGAVKKTGCLLMGTSSQIELLNKKLYRQPFGLNELAQGLALSVKNYRKEKFTLKLGRHKIHLGDRTAVMGIVNLTPDSFSGDGLFTVHSSQFTVSRVIDYAKRMVEEGADIIDVGGESSRPGARPVSEKEELRRVVPVIKELVRKVKAPVSIDTCKPEVARQALDNGAVIVNDITGLRNPLMRKAVSRHKAGVVIMHMKGKPRTMQKNPQYLSLLDEIIGYLKDAIDAAEACGIDKEKIIIDPGIGFGKTAQHNLEILNRLKELKVLGRPILVGTSRKSFIGKILGVTPQERIFGTISSCVVAAKNGAKIVRVHDVKAARQALDISDRL